MCGIAGIVGVGAVEQRAAMERMLLAMGHRGPDGQGLYAAPSGLCLLGHRRLSILDLTDAAAQPMLSPDRRHVIVYNGECYNYPELKAGRESHGETFRSSGDTEVVLRCLTRDGPQALPLMNAMFALALWDESGREVLLARDRFGQKPLYFAKVRGCLVFASEVRALLASGLVERALDMEGVRSYLSFGAVQGPGTIVKGVWLLAPASYLIVDAGGRTYGGAYWTPPVEKEPCTPGDLRESFRKAVKRHLISDAPIGLFLSGGIDSSAVAAAACHAGTGPVKSLSVVFPDQPAQSEAGHARRMAIYAGTQHQEVPITGAEMLRMLPAALQGMDQPTSDGINTFVVSHGARLAGLKVALSGLGGDELFAGYDVFWHVPRMLWLRHHAGLLRAIARRALAGDSQFAKTGEKWLDLCAAPDDLMSVYLARRKLFASRELKRLAPALASGEWTSGVLPEHEEALASLARNRHVQDAVGLLEMSSYMGQTLLRDSDVMGMAHSLEIRTPFLDADFAGMALAADWRVRTRRHTSKWFFVEAMRDWLPPENVHRAKQGFTLPLERWMQKELRAEIEEELQGLAQVGDLFSRPGVDALWRCFLAHPEQVRWIRPWSLFVLSRYLRTHGIR